MEINGFKALYAYSRKEALLDGEQYRADPEVTKELGIQFPVFLTRAVYKRYVQAPIGSEDQFPEGDRLRLLCNQFVLKWMRVDSGVVFIKLTVIVGMEHSLEPNERWHESTREIRIARLDCAMGVMDLDNPAPAITIYIPGEE
ncbi:MAG TPA: hypothetical protein DCL77_01755 [Prolixibacteraceae bacterium]|jgi:hypothetical protein|nr:hypothetical protein [Prolixibacteraceae bacterium]